MAERWVANASPLIALAQIRRLDLVEVLPLPLLVPSRVLSELEPGNAQHGAADAVRGALYFSVVPQTSVHDAVARWQLDAGETHVLSVAMGHPAAGVVLDDLAARRCAQSLGIRVIGTLGLVARAKLSGKLRLAAPVLDALKDAGLFLSPRLCRALLADLGEGD